MADNYDLGIFKSNFIKTDLNEIKICFNSIKIEEKSKLSAEKFKDIKPLKISKTRKSNIL